MKLSIFFVPLFMAFTSCAQPPAYPDIPAVIVNAFQQQFPKAADVAWKETGPLYKVSFETGLLGHDHDAWFDTKGKLVKNKEEIPASSLPAEVKKTAERQFARYRLDDVDKIDDNGVIFYEVELKNRKDERKVVFSADGKVLENVPD